MAKKLAQYLLQQNKANQLKQAAIDEAAGELVASIENTFKAMELVRTLAPEYEFAKLSEFRKLAAQFGLAKLSTSEPETGKRRGRGKAKATKGKTTFKLSDEKAGEILDFIGKGEKSTKEIADKLKTKNASNALTFLKNQGKIEVARKDGLKKFWKRA